MSNTHLPTIIHQISEIYFRFLKILLTALMILLLIPVFLQVVSRFVDFIPRYIWTEEIARFAFVWIIMIGATIAVRDGSHFNVDILPRVSGKVGRQINFFLLCAMLFFASIFLIGGFSFAKFGSSQHSEISGLPMLTLYIGWPIAGLSWILFLTEKIYDHFNIKKDM